jgi:beta-glucosidase
VELPDTLGFGQHLVERVRRGELPESIVDRAARRLLTQKVQLGLLDPAWTPEGSVSAAGTVGLDSPANRALALELAERSVVLLDAGTALPLLGEGRPALRRVAVVGPGSTDPLRITTSHSVRSKPVWSWTCMTSSRPATSR